MLQSTQVLLLLVYWSFAVTVIFLLVSFLLLLLAPILTFLFC